jgi:hypothetical protein
MRVISILTLFILTISLQAQKFYTRDGKASFVSEAPLEKIEAVNNKVTAILNTETGRIEFAVLIKAFQFEKALMQEHFNENYLESDKFPKSIFKGYIQDWQNLDLGSDQKQEVTVKGELEMHGVTQEIEVSGEMEVIDENIVAESNFSITLEDYQIKIPAIVKDNIARDVNIKIFIILEPFSK